METKNIYPTSGKELINFPGVYFLETVNGSMQPVYQEAETMSGEQSRLSKLIEEEPQKEGRTTKGVWIEEEEVLLRDREALQ
jgi:hypothetical protein